MASIIRSDDMIIVAINNQPYVVYADDSQFDKLCEALDSSWNWTDAELLRLISYGARAEEVQKQLADAGIMTDSNGRVINYKSNPIAEDLSKYVIACVKEGDVTAVISFIKRLYENPNERTRGHLFQFMETNKLPMLNSGEFLAYKVVRSNYLDKASGSFSNHPGSKMPVKDWCDVDLDPERLCSKGFHVCAKEYIPSFYSSGDRIVTVAVNPEDVGAIPFDYHGTKMRCRTYRVVDDITSTWLQERENIKIRISAGEGIMADREKTPPTLAERFC